MNQEEYLLHQEEKSNKYEMMCRRCGVCCGSEDGDPCANLMKDDFNRYFCGIYDNRVGLQKTVSGKEFNCVPIRDVIIKEGARQDCAYALERKL